MRSQGRVIGAIVAVVVALAGIATLGATALVGGAAESGTAEVATRPLAASIAQQSEPAPAATAAAVDCCRSDITQDLVDRNPLPGGGFEIVIEATLDSNAVCHVLLLQCVVEPESAPANMTLQSVECLSPRWANIDITIPFVGPVNVCARFDANRAGQDQKFRFTYTTPLDTGSVRETVKFFRFPEELLFIRAVDTITIDLTHAADILEECDDLAEIGTQATCTVRVEVQPGSNVPAASVVRTSPAQLTNGSLTPDADPADWDCTVPLTCAYTANGGVLLPGEYTFTATSDVVAPVGIVEDCSAILTGATTIADSCDTLTVYAASDAFANLEMAADRSAAPPGTAIVWSVTFTNDGPDPVQGARLVNDTPDLMSDLTIRQVGGPGSWTCTSGPSALTCDLVPGDTIPAGESTVFEIRGVIESSAEAGAVIVSEVEMTYANDPFGPEFPLRDGTTVEVLGVALPTFTG